MEAVAAFGLACNVLQVVQVAYQASNTILQTYKYGISTDKAEIENVATHLSTLTNNLVLSISGSQSGSAISASEAEVRELASQCCDVAQKMNKELDELKADGTKRDALFKGLKATRKRSHIEHLESKLSRLQNLLNTSILIRLREQNESFVQLQQGDFKLLEKSLRGFMQDLANRKIDLDSYINSQYGGAQQTAILERSGRGIPLISIFENLRREPLTEGSRDQILKSLRFDNIFARQNQISDAATNTFQWIFEEDLPTPWPSFAVWLREGKGVYRIKGKAGSGKSTLVKFILEHDQTKLQLSSWSSKHTPKIIAHCFWLAGSSSQRNLHGFLCSILYQILEGETSRVSWLLENDPGLANKHTTSDWSTKKLKTCLFQLLADRDVSRPLCIILDGIDEFDRSCNYDELLMFVRELGTLKWVRLCITHRPDPRIEEFFGEVLPLRLQDLTEPDIKQYVESRCEELSQRLSNEVDQKLLDNLVETIVGKADGVFLWVHLVLDDLLRGLKNHDTLSELSQRVERLPRDIERLYEDMLHRLGEDWQIYDREAALYLKMCYLATSQSQLNDIDEMTSKIYRLNFSVLSTAIVADKAMHQTPLHKIDFRDARRIVGMCQRTESRLGLCCAGMLETTNMEKVPEGKKDKTDHTLRQLYEYREMGIRFTHRSVLDFLSTPSGAAILNKTNADDSDLLKSIYKAYFTYLLAFMCVHGCKKNDWIVHFLTKISIHAIQDDIPLQLMSDISEIVKQAFAFQYAPTYFSVGLRERSRLEYEELMKMGERALNLEGFFVASGIPSHYFESPPPTGSASGSVQLTHAYLCYLLECATLSARSHRQSFEDLLKRGADPNCNMLCSPHELAPRTPWIRLTGDLGKHFRLQEKDGQSRYKRMIAAYIQHGARLDQKSIVKYVIGALSRRDFDLFDYPKDTLPSSGDNFIVVSETTVQVILRRNMWRSEGDHSTKDLLPDAKQDQPMIPRLIIKRFWKLSQSSSSSSETAALVPLSEIDRQLIRDIIEEDFATLDYGKRRLTNISETIKTPRTPYATTADRISSLYDRYPRVNLEEWLRKERWLPDPDDASLPRAAPEKFIDTAEK